MRIEAARFFVYASDLARSLHFYTRLLGLQVVDRVIGGTVLAAGAMELEVLQERRDEDALLDRRTGFLLIVDDADAAFAALSPQGVTILSEPATDHNGTRMFYIADPDGLPIGILSEPAQQLPSMDWLMEEQ